MQKKFEQFRKDYPVFRYNGFDLSKGEDEIKVVFNFQIDGLCEFHPSTRIKTENLDIVNDFDSETGRHILFSLGLVEAVSYWKCACPPKMIVNGYLSDKDVIWWKKLYYNGLGEFFFRNGIETSFEDFVTIEADGKKYENCPYKTKGKNLIPVGGGKDSDVTMELLSDFKNDNMFFTVNDQAARTEAVLAAGYCEEDILKTYRTISPELLERNKEGFLNGHTPFSAIVAFLSLYCSYLIGGENIVLSNEASANEGNIGSSGVNHQYSKSYEFESDFNSYCREHFNCDIKYFSLLRCFNELQIARQFSAFEKFRKIFKSCNAGSKKNIWCGNCAKCLFVYIILSPFLSEKELTEIFGKNMLNDENMIEDFKGLVGITGVKPFECIGTVDEVCTACGLTVEKSNGELPLLLKIFKENKDINPDYNLLKYFNKENNIPEKFKSCVERMYAYVSRDL